MDRVLRAGMDAGLTAGTVLGKSNLFRHGDISHRTNLRAGAAENAFVIYREITFRIVIGFNIQLHAEPCPESVAEGALQ